MTLTAAAEAAGEREFVSAVSSAPSVNATEVSVYGMDSWAEGFLELPADKQSFQLKVSGASSVSYRVWSGTAKVDENGVVTPGVRTWYWYGNIGYSSPRSDAEPDSITRDILFGDSVVRVTADGKTFDVTVHVKEYASEYASEQLDKRIAEVIKPGMSDLEKIQEAAKYAASFAYNYRYQGWENMIVCGGGDCWASTNLVNEFCTRLGFKAWIRNGNRDAGAGSGHRNSLVQASDGTIYEVEAGYGVSTTPRPWNVTKRDSLFSYRYVSAYSGYEVYQYDGYENPEELVIPETIEGKPVVGIGDSFIVSESGIKSVVIPDTVRYFGKSAFNSCSDLETLNFPASLESIGEFAFTNLGKLSNITVPNGCAFTYSGGGIYDKDFTKLYFAPNTAEIDIPDTVETIGQYAFYYNSNIKEIYLPSSVKTAELGAFCTASSLEKLVLNNGLESVGQYGCAGSGRLNTVIVPDSQTQFGEDVFHNHGSALVIYGRSGSAAESYASANGITFSTDIPETAHNILTNASLSLNGKVSINFYADLTEEMLDSGAFARITHNDKTYDIPLKSSMLTENGCKIEYPVSAKQLHDKVNIKLFDKDGNSVAVYKQSASGSETRLSGGFDYSAADYINAVKQVCSPSDKLYKLVSALDTYGAYAQEYFGYDVSTALNANKRVSIKDVTADSLSIYKPRISASAIKGVKLTNFTLTVGSDNSFRIYFKADDPNKHTYTVNGKQAAYKTGNGQYYLEMPNIASRYLGRKCTVTIDGVKIDCCALSYSYLVLNGSSDSKLTNLCKALAVYEQAAVDYFK